jgi:hypothetical protein
MMAHAGQMALDLIDMAFRNIFSFSCDAVVTQKYRASFVPTRLLQLAKTNNYFKYK